MSCSFRLFFTYIELVMSKNITYYLYSFYKFLLQKNIGTYYVLKSTPAVGFTIYSL